MKAPGTLALPREVRDGRGQYRSIDLPVVKMLRAAGERYLCPGDPLQPVFQPKLAS
jgi:hypothetical protein